MSSPAPPDLRTADRIHRAALVGLLLLPCAPLVSSGVPKLKWASIGAAFLGALVLLILRARRRFGAIALLSVSTAFVGLLAAALVSRGPEFFIWLVLFFVLLAVSLASGEIRRWSAAPVRHGGTLGAGFAASLWGLIAAVSVLACGLTIMFFLVLPRTAQTAFAYLVPGRASKPLYEKEIRLGRTPGYARSSAPVLRARFVGARPSMPVKWRIGLLERFDGHAWLPVETGRQSIRVQGAMAIVASDDERRLAAPRFTYELLMEPLVMNSLAFIGSPEVIWIETNRLTRSAGGGFELDTLPRTRLRYGVLSRIEEYCSGPPPEAVNLELPPLDPRVHQLARRITSLASSDETRAFAIERYLASRYRYSLEPQRPVADPLADFLFNRRAGHCEDFASATAVLLRSIGIPSRIVIGFRQGELNPVSGWVVVRASDAHSWVEAWIRGRGWMELDPTPPAPLPRSRLLGAGLSAYLDALDMLWQDWVMDYNLSRQVWLASRVQSSGRQLQAWGADRIMATLDSAKRAGARAAGEFGRIALLLAIGGMLAWWLLPQLTRWLRIQRRLRSIRRGLGASSDASLLYTRFLSTFRRHGFRKPASLTASEFLQTLPEGMLRQAAAEFIRLYYDARFGGRPEAVQKLAHLLGDIRRSLRRSSWRLARG